jgi:hypothetical protein
MTTKEKFKAYYLPWLIAMAAIFGFKFVISLFDNEQRHRVTSAEGIILLIAIIAVTGLLCGGIYHWFFDVYRPKRMIRLFNKIKHLDLREVGLNVDENDNTFKGNYKGYYLTMFTDSSPDTGDWIRTNALIIPGETHEALYNKLKRSLNSIRTTNLSGLQSGLK